MTKLEKTALILIAVMVLALALLLIVPRGSAAGRWPAWDPQSSLDLGICLRAERDSYNAEEYAALSYCLLKTWRVRNRVRGWTMDETIRNYCAVFKKTDRRYYGKRPDRIRRSTWVKPLHRPKSDPDWTKLRRFVTRFQKKEVADPCPRCTDWYGPTVDEKPPTWTCPLKLANWFCYPMKD